MPARVVPPFNLMHHPVPPLVVLALTAIGIVPPVTYVGAIVWLGHIVLGLGVGDRVRGRDGSSGRSGRSPGLRREVVTPELARRQSSWGQGLP
jgi:hypothetical protein